VGLVAAPGFIDLHALGQSVPADRIQAFDGVTTLLELELGSLPVAARYEQQAASGCVINYGTSVAWAFARIAAMTGAEPEPSIGFMGRMVNDRRWADSEVVYSLLDSVIWRAATLDAVICLVDTRHLLDEPRITADTLCRAQISGADFIALNKVDLLLEAEQKEARARVAAIAPHAHVFPCTFGGIPPEIQFGAALRQLLQSSPRSTTAVAPPSFETLSWIGDVPFSLSRFQAVIGTLAPDLVRAKGILEFREQPGRPMLFQLAGRRAMLGAAPPAKDRQAAVRLVLIAERGQLDTASVRSMLAGCEAVE
jgi:hypothetical protein